MKDKSMWESQKIEYDQSEEGKQNKSVNSGAEEKLLKSMNTKDGVNSQGERM